MLDFKQIENAWKAILAMPDSKVLVDLLCHLITNNLNEFTDEEIIKLKNMALSQIKVYRHVPGLTDMFRDVTYYNTAFQILKTILPRLKDRPEDVFLKLKTGFHDGESKECLEFITACAPKFDAAQTADILKKLLVIKHPNTNPFDHNRSNLYPYTDINIIFKKRQKAVAAYTKECTNFDARELLIQIHHDLKSRDVVKIGNACFRARGILSLCTNYQLQPLEQQLMILINTESTLSFSQLTSWTNGPFAAWIALTGEKIIRYQDLYSVPLTQSELIGKILMPLTSKLLSVFNALLNGKDHHWLPEIINALMVLSDQLDSLPGTVYPVKLIERQFLKTLEPYLASEKTYIARLAGQAMIKFSGKLSPADKNTAINKVLTALLGPEGRTLKETDWHVIESVAEYFTDTYVDGLLNQVYALINKNAHYEAISLLKIIAANKYTELQMDKILVHIDALLPIAHNKPHVCNILALLGRHYHGTNSSRITLISTKLIGELSNGDDRVRHNACLALGTIAIKLDKDQAISIADALAPLLQDSDARVRPMACESMMQLFSKLDPEYIQSMLSKAPKDSPEQVAMKNYSDNLALVAQYEAKEAEPDHHPITDSFYNF